MPDLSSELIDPDIQGELDGLRLLVEETEGSVIAFVRFRRVTEREAGVRYLKEQLSLPVEERVLSEERQNPLTLLDNLPDERCCVQFYDLEEALPEITGYLNVNRDAYADVPHALVFWVGEHGLREVATNAPDFWAWRSGVFDVRSDGPGLSQSMSQVALADDVQFTSRGDLERRAQLYKGLIQEYEEEDEEYIARLRLKLSAIHLRLRRPKRSEQEVRWVKEYAERENDKKTAAYAYHHLGTAAQKRRNFEEAEKWYRKAVEIARRLDNVRILAQILHNLGAVAQEQRNFEEAEKWYRKAVEIVERLNDERKPGSTYHNLGTIAQERRDYEEAEKWYRKAVEIAERLGNERALAQTYHELGRAAQAQRDLKGAEAQYRKSTEICERLGDDYGAAKTYGQRGHLARERDDFRAAGKWYLMAVQKFASANDEENLNQALGDFLSLFEQNSPDIQKDLRQQWLDAGLSEDKLDDLLDEVRAEQSG